MFRGLTAISIDEKGRITIPSQYRKTIEGEKAGNELVVTIDPEDRCLLLYPSQQWQIIEEKLQELPSLDPASRRIQRLLMGHATDLKLDRHGRIILPPLLREYAGLDKTIMLVGQGKKFEIWGEAQWHLGRASWLADGLSEDSKVPEELASLVL